jgi:hypothetical protein
LNGDPDVGALAAVVEALYANYGYEGIIFLGAFADTVDDVTLTDVGAAVQTDLGVRVLPASAAHYLCITGTPFDPQTGEIGIGVILGRSDLADDGRLTVEAGVVWGSLAAVGYEFTLERAGEVWQLAELTETWVS